MKECSIAGAQLAKRTRYRLINSICIIVGKTVPVSPLSEDPDGIDMNKMLAARKGDFFKVMIRFNDILC